MSSSSKIEKQTNLRRGYVDKSLIVTNLQAKNAEDAIRYLAKLLHERGYVQEQYGEVVVERETKFPTGLPTAGVQVAIPHADSTYVLKSGVAVGVLKQPVRFQVMGSPDSSVNVKIVFLLAVADSSKQTEYLSKLIRTFSSTEVIQDIAQSTDAEHVYEVLSRELGMEESL